MKDEFNMPPGVRSSDIPGNMPEKKEESEALPRSPAATPALSLPGYPASLELLLASRETESPRGSVSVFPASVHERDSDCKLDVVTHRVLVRWEEERATGFYEALDDYGDVRDPQRVFGQYIAKRAAMIERLKRGN